MKKEIMKLGDIFKLANEEGGTATIPIRIKKGEIAKEDKGLFELLSLTGESDSPIFKVVEVTDKKILLEISPDGVSNIVKEIIKLESDNY